MSLAYIKTQAEGLARLLSREIEEGKHTEYNDSFKAILDKINECMDEIREEHGNTKIGYMYRDACNYKTFTEVVVRGIATDDQIQTMMNSLSDGEYFIPEEIGLPCNRTTDEPDIDGIWCEINPQCFETTFEEPTENISIDELVDKFSKAGTENWNQAYWEEEFF